MAQETFTEAEFWAKLDAVGENQVRINLIKKIYGDHGAKRDLVLEWLRRKEEARALEASAKRDAREEATLAIAKSAKASVRYDRYIAIAAITIAAIAAHKEIMWLISSVMSWFSK